MLTKYSAVDSRLKPQLQCVLCFPFLAFALAFLSLCAVLLTIMSLVTYFLSLLFISGNRNENSAQRDRGKSKIQKTRSTL